MLSPQPHIRLGLAWWEALLVIVAFVVPAYYGGRAVALLTSLAAGIAFGVWRCVRILGQLLEMRQAEFFDDSDHG